MGAYEIVVDGNEGSSIAEKMSVSDAISIYPNPVTETLHIATDQSVLKVELLNILGETLRTFKGVKTLDLSGVPSGEYLVRVYTEDGSAVRKVVKR